MDTMKPVNVAGGTIVVQVCLLTIIALGIALERDSESSDNRRCSLKQRAYGLTVVLAILSIIAVALSTDFYQVWSPLLGDVGIPTLNRSHAFVVVFMLDIIAVICLIEWSGGSRSSPFTSMLFLIPALAIFLREPPVKFLIYAGVVSVYYFFTCMERGRYKMPLGWAIDSSLQSHRVVNLGCLGLAMLTGYITRPVAL